MTAPLSQPIVYLNGAFLPADQAQVPVLDRGFIFGDGIYEVIPAYGGHLFRLDPHLARLENSLAGARMDNPHDRTDWARLLEETVRRNRDATGDSAVYVQVTRGVARRDHGFPADTPPTVFAMCNPLPPASARVQAGGVGAITLEDIRWQYCHIKAIALLPNILLRQTALDKGSAEAILVRDGLITEGAASNVFMVNDGQLTTPPTGPHLLSGITRELVIELARDHGLPCHETDFDASALRQADEIWLTSSTREILPVTHLNGQSVGDARPGPVWQRLYRLYQDYKQHLRCTDRPPV